MTGEAFVCLRADVNEVGVIGVDHTNGQIEYCEGVSSGLLKSGGDAGAIIQRVWNQLPALLEEMSCLMEDNQRMRIALESVQASSMYAMTGTVARSTNPEDYWQAKG